MEYRKRRQQIADIAFNFKQYFNFEVEKIGKRNYSYYLFDELL